MSTAHDTLTADALFTRTRSIADAIETLLRGARHSIDAALYRFTNPRLAQALNDACLDGVRVRLVTDRGKYEEGNGTQELLSRIHFPFRHICGREGEGSKMHHKFVLLDDSVLLTGSYNWTAASEEKNYENLLVLHDPKLIEIHREEFDAIWRDAEEE